MSNDRAAPDEPRLPVALFVDAQDPALDSEYGPTIKHAVLDAILL